MVDDEKLNQKCLIILIKRSSKPIGDFTVKLIEDFKEECTKKLGIDVCYNCYLRGHFDWMICFSARDIKVEKKFSGSINTFYSEFIIKIHMLEKIFPIKTCGIVNPGIKKFKEIFQ